MEQRVSLITLGVADLERARRFYADGLGWKPAGIGEGQVWFFQLPGAVLGLWPRSELAADAGITDDRTPGGFSGITLAYNARTRVEVETVMREAEAAGGRMVRPAREVFWGGYSGYFTDPDGHLWEVAWNRGFALDADGRVTLPD